MDKYQAFTLIGILQVIMISVIIISAGVFKNWYLLWLLLLCGTSSSEKRILGIKD